MNKKERASEAGKMEREKLDKCVRWEETRKTEVGNTALFPRQIKDCCLKYRAIFHQNSEFQLIIFECSLQMQFIPALGVIVIDL